MRVRALEDWHRVGLKKDMFGTLIQNKSRAFTSSTLIVWDDLKEDYPYGVYHPTHHKNYVWTHYKFKKLEEG